MRTRAGLAIAALAAASYLVCSPASAQDVIIDTGAGNSSTVGGLSAFNDSGSGSFQFVGMKVSFAEDVEIGRIDAWINGFGTIDVKLRANTAGIPGAVLESETVDFFNFPTGWLIVSDLSWNVSAGDYWVTFEFEPDFGNATFPVGVPNPLSNYAFFSDGNPNWSAIGTSFPMGLRVYTPAPPEPVLVPGEFATIQDAIDFVSSGQVIEVAPGTYSEAISFNGKTIRIQSAGGPGVTTIDATGLNQPVVRVTSGSGANTRLSGFTITGGVHVTSLAEGGGLSIDGGTITVEDCTITQNTAESGGGAAIVFGGSATFNNCTFDDNDNLGSFNSGGGAYVNNGVAHFNNCVFTNNDVSSSGGAMNVNVAGTVTATECTFANNTAENAGGVLVIGSTANATFTDCTFDGNSAVQAGGAMINGATASFVGCDFISNVATFAGSTSGGGIQAQGAANMTITGCDFVANQAFFGGGVQYINVAGTKTIAGSRFRNNTADNNGGAISIIGRGPTVSTTEFCGNAPNHLGGSIVDGGGNTFSSTCTPDNNSPSQPQPIDVGGGSVNATLAGATNSGSSSCEPDGVDVFFEFTIANGPVDILIDTCGSSADTALAVFDEGENEVGCSTSCGGNPCSGSTACLGLSSLDNGTYIIRVSLETGAVAGSGLDFILSISEAELLTPGDFNNDMTVDENDRALLCDALGSTTGQPNFIDAADFDDNGVINHLDQQAFNELLAPCGGDIVANATFLPPADGFIDGADLAYLLGAWGPQPSCADMVSNATFQPPPDGMVDGADLAYLLGSWGRCR